MVDVGVGDDDLFDLQIVFADQGEDVFDFVTGVDDHGFVGGFVADDGAVALQRADGEDFVDHFYIVDMDAPADVKIPTLSQRTRQGGAPQRRADR